METGILEKVQQFGAAHKMFDEVKNIVVGVSGGADSMCLLHILMRLRRKYGYQLSVVHVHHGIRGEDADGDMAYVEEYCRELGIPFYGFHYFAEELAKEWHMTVEEAGRKIRYQSFERVLSETGGGRIAVAHNSDDVSETFLFQLFRGSGIHGLSGISPVRDNIIRPVLCLCRTEILEYLEKNGIDYRTDVTNEGCLYTRNKIRNHILPYVKREINEQVSKHIFQAAAALRETAEYMDMQAEETFLQAVISDQAKESNKVCFLSVEEIQKKPKIIQSMVIRKGICRIAGQLKDISSVHVQMVLELLEGETGKMICLPQGVLCKKDYGILKICKEREKECVNAQVGKEFCVRGTFTPEEGEKVIELPDYRGSILLKMEKKVNNHYKNEEKMYTKSMDYDILKSNFDIRTRRSGDYIVINRDGGRKKIKDYFIDKKVSKDMRDKVLLLARDSEVLWIIGYRLSERCKVSEHTERVVRLTYFPD